MSVASSVALAVAARVERSGGPRAGLVAWKTLVAKSADGEVRGKALVAALRCAVALRDVGALDELTVLWQSVDRGVWDAAIAALCKEMARAGLLPRATALAEVEARRHRTARSLYTHARCLDVASDPSAADAFRAATARAEKEGAKDIELSSRVRRVAILARALSTLPEALEEARLVDLAHVPPTSKLVVARVLLRSPSRFVRAAAIGTLDEIALGDDPALAARALRIAARWVDDAGDALTPLEVDRLVALFGRERVMKAAPGAKDAMVALDRITQAKDDEALDAALEQATRIQPELGSLHARARDILRGRFEVPRDGYASPPHDPAQRRASRHAEILDVVVAMRDRVTARAARSLSILAEAEEAGEHLPREVLGVAHAALEYDDSARDAGTSGAGGALDNELREAAMRLVAARLRRSIPGAPPRGFVALADTLASLGSAELAMTARRAAAVAREPGAAESLGTALARSGWELARTGDRAARAQAIQKLREAKALLDTKR